MQELIDSFLAKFPGVDAYLEIIRVSARREGLVRTMYGRVRPLKGLHSMDPGYVEFDGNILGFLMTPEPLIYIATIALILTTHFSILIITYIPTQNQFICKLYDAEHLVRQSARQSTVLSKAVLLM